MKSQPVSAPLALWLDPETPLSQSHAQVLNETGWAVLSVDTLDGLIQHAPHASAIVLRLAQDVTRLKAVQQLLQDANVSLPVVCRVDRQELELAVGATQAGASAVLALQDTRVDSWQQLRENLFQNTAPAAPVRHVRHVVFVDPASQHLLALAQKVAQAEVTALLVGPTGAGKEVLARVLHEASPRARGPFVALNCAAMPENLIEDMLFGHEKGAFTGAHREHKGLFEQAQGGTLFLDEIGEMPMPLQSKLLRVLQEKQLTRLGGQTVIPLNVRIVAATNKDLRLAIEQREFREDLYYRIATFRMRLLPLKDRPGDIIPLAVQSLVQNDNTGKAWQIHPQAQAQLLQYPWPGNVRELENVMRRALVLCPDHIVTPAHLMFDDWLTTEAFAPIEKIETTVSEDRATLASASALLSAAPHDAQAWSAPFHTTAPQTPPHAVQDLHSASRMNEHQVIMATLAATPSKQEAAKRLGISPRTLRYKLAQLREHGLGMATAN